MDYAIEESIHETFLFSKMRIPFLRNFLPLCSIHGVARLACILVKCDPAYSSQLIGPEVGSKLKLGQLESFPGTLEAELRNRSPFWSGHLSFKMKTHSLLVDTFCHVTGKGEETGR